MKKLALLLIVSLLAFGAVGAGKASAAPLCRVHFNAAGYVFNGTVGRSSRTSCPFARNVDQKATSFLIRHGGGYSYPFIVRAWSPVTFRYYRMACASTGNVLRSVARFACRGGIGAAVYSTVWTY